MTKKLKVILIGGCGRSGSTLLGRVLENSLSARGVGELRYIWERGLQENQLCGCGQPFRECSFWNAVLEPWQARSPLTDIAELVTIKNKLERIRGIIPFLFPRLQSPAWRKMYEDYTGALLEVFKIIHEQSGSEFIVDSSKDVGYVYLLNSLAERGEIELFVIHLVRDSRAVAYSWQKQKRRPEIHWSEENMPILSTTSSAILWNSVNILVGMIGKLARQRYFFVRYEDFVHSIDGSVAQIAHFVQADPASLRSFGEAQMVELGFSHTVSGNPMRFEQGRIHIQPDIEWQRNLAQRAKRQVTLLTLPLLFLYGYI